MAEALTRQAAGDRAEAYSAGSHPAGYIHPLAQATMQSMGVSLEGQCSKSWDSFLGLSMDIIITLCDHAAREPCPAWPGQPATAHWGFQDPVGLMATEPERLAFCRVVAEGLKVRIERMLALDLDDLSPEDLQKEVQALATS